MKTKYNKSEILKSAWRMVKKFQMSLSLALKNAWREAKETIKETISNIKTDFDINGTSGQYFYNAFINKFQVSIDCVDFMLTDDVEHFDTEQEMLNYVNNL